MTAPPREAEIAAFLSRHGWGAARRLPLAGDASFRRYERLVRGDERAVLMDAPRPHEDVGPYLTVTGHLRRAGYSAPEVLAADREAGLLLLEDLGDDLFTRLLTGGDAADEEDMYATAVDLLVDLHRRPAAADLPPYDDARLIAEADLLVDWYLPALDGGDVAPAAKARYRELWRALFPVLDGLPRVLVLRDYHADNLIWLPERAGTARVGLLDFQDAVAGSPAYDLVSLLEDARRDVAAELAEAMVRRYLAATGADETAFRTAYAVLGAQRNAKIVGIFTRLWRRDGKSRYLDYLPRVWRLLEGDLAHPALASMRAWFDRHIPVERRRRDLRGASA